MNHSQAYLRYFALFSILSLCLIGQASSIKCYTCHSDAVDGCITGNLTKAYQVDCTGKSASKYSLFSGINDSLDKAEKASIEFGCNTFKGVALSDGRTVIIRGCMPTYVTCDTSKIMAVTQALEYAIQLDTCKRCDSDLCNSSGHLKAGFWILSLSVLMTYLIKFLNFMFY